MSVRFPRWTIVLTATLLTGGAAALGGSTAANAGAACPQYNPPNTMTLVAGTPQSAQLGNPYATNLQVSISNANGCPVTTGLAGIPVTFAAPSSGPSGTFADSGSNAVLVGTNEAGIAAAPQLTANRSAGGFTVVASSDYGTVGFSLVNTASGVPAMIVPVIANESAIADSRYAKPLQATVLDANHNPVEGVTVTFALGAGTAGDGAGASFADGTNEAVATTDGAGIATSPSFTANSTVGRFTATASTDGVVEPADFALDNLVGKAPTMTAFGATHRTSTVGAHYVKRLQVRLRDRVGRPLEGVVVTFTLGASGSTGDVPGIAGASFVGGTAQAAETTNGNGIATSPRLTANTTAGTFAATATASVTGDTVSFALHNRAGEPVTITAGAGASESTTVGTLFPVRLAVTVGDRYGNPVAGVSVTFRAPRDGASGRFDGTRQSVKVKTVTNGIAVAPRFVANRTRGGYAVRAVAAGHAAAFALVNQPAS